MDFLKDKVPWTKPDEVPTNLSPLERAIIAARNINLWAEWLLETGPALEMTDTLRDVGPKDEAPS